MLGLIKGFTELYEEALARNGTSLPTNFHDCVQLDQEENAPIPILTSLQQLFSVKRSCEDLILSLYFHVKWHTKSNKDGNFK